MSAQQASNSAPRPPLSAPARPSRWRAVRFLADMRTMGSAHNIACSLLNRLYLRDRAGRWPGSRRVVGLNTPELDQPVYVRLGATDMWVYEEIFQLHEYDAALDPRLGPCRTVVDLGANIGLSVRFWRSRMPGCRVVAVEPDAGNFAVLQRNSAACAEPAPAPVLIRACVAGVRGTVNLDHSGGEWGVRISDAASGTDQVEAITLPDVLERAGITGEIDLLKCDIEGSERSVFADCADWIHRIRAMFVELHGEYTPDDFAADLRRAGYASERRELKRIKDVCLLLVTRRA